MRIKTCLAIAAAVLPAILLGPAVPASAALTSPADDRINSTPTSHWVYANLSPAEIAAKLDANSARITDLEIVQTAFGPKLSVAMVRNAGTYQTAWWWYYGKTLAQISTLLGSDRRLIDLEPYMFGGSLRYAAVMVDNTAGPDSKTWWWYANTTFEFLQARVTENNGRLIDLDSLVVGGTRRFFGVMISNEGRDATTWFWFTGRTIAQIKALLPDKRIISMDRRSDDRYDVVFHASDGKRFWFYVNVPSSSWLAAKAAQVGARIIDIETHSTTGGTGYSAVMIDNMSGLNATLRNEMWSSIPNGMWGFYLKKVGGPVLAAHMHKRRFEPASSIKAFIHLHAMLKEQLESSNDDVVVTRRTGYNGSCPTGGLTNTTIGNADMLMMQNSDNQMTDALLRHFTAPRVLATADLIGANDTEFNHVLGCLKPHNVTTLVDLSKITEFQMNGKLLDPTFRDKFHDREINESWSGFDPFYCAIVDEEAEKVDLDPQTAQDFCDAMVFNAKGGSYTEFLSATQQSIWRSDAGRMSLPFKTEGEITPVHYAYGHFIDTVKIARTAGAETPIQEAREAMVREMWRDEINAALQTWL